MKKLFGLALLLSVQSAFAGYGSMTIGEYATLKDCGGTIKVTESNNGGSEQVNIKFDNVVKCSNFDIVSLPNYQAVKLQGKDRARSGSFTIPKQAIGSGFNSIEVLIRSDKNKTSDRIRVMFINVTTPTYDMPATTVEY